MGREFELKYRATSEQQAAVEAFFPLQWQCFHMETTYFDTPEGDVAARRWTLRRRMENQRSVCTVKTPAPGGGRGEWETECGDIHLAIPELCKLGAPGELAPLASRPLYPLCGARFVRHAGTLTLEDCTLEIALDHGVLIGGSRELPLCEIEVELKTGSEQAAVAFAQSLARRFGLVPEEKSKYRRALELARMP